MAEIIEEEDPAEAKSGLSVMTLAIVLGIMTIVAGGAGAGLGLMLTPGLNQSKAKAKAAEAEEAKNDEPSNYSSGQFIQAVPPIVTNLAQPSKTFIRLESSLLFKEAPDTNPEVIAEKLSGDYIALLRTISLSRLEGPSAIHHLREDLFEFASLRAGGKVEEVIIKSLVVE